MSMLAVIVFFLILLNTPISHATLSIVDINHPANYKLTINPNNLDQLTDGKIAKHPIWTRNGSLGWVNRTPLSISLSVDAVFSHNISCKGAIRIHTGKSIRSGVYVPKRFDVYASKNDGGYEYLAGRQINIDDYSDGESHWVEISNVNLYRDMVLVVHASNRFIMLDEVEVSTGDCVDLLLEDNKNLHVNDPVIDSVSRLKAYYKTTSSQSEKNIQKGLVSHVFNNVDEYTSGVTSKYQVPNNIIGFNGESESRIIVIYNGSNKKVDLNLEDLYVDVKESIKVYQIEKVMAANGKSIYDPLIPVSGDKLSIDSNSEILLLIKFVLNENTQEKKISLVFNSAEKNNVLKIDFSINVFNLIDIDLSPQINVWAYRQDYLFKIDEDKSMEIMSDCGVNVFLLHPSLLPGNKHRKEWTLKDRDGFIDDLAFYKNKGLILLFVDWSARVTSYEKSKSVDKKLITKWLSQITTVMTEVGIPYDQWALYPVDEPSGTDLEYLYDLVTVVKNIDDNIQIYANPISTNSDPTYFGQIRKISDQIDYWQPDIKYIKKQGFNHFSLLNKKWWIYSNPKSPAKTSGDLFYRAMAWNAWLVGATGIGFWSFSDSGKSSAWDDFDGTRPDYAVVYEYKNTIVTSLRWESFCDGVEDFRLLNSEKYKTKLRSVISKNLDNSIHSRDDIYKNRQYIYDLYSKHPFSNSLDIQ